MLKNPHHHPYPVGPGRIVATCFLAGSLVAAACTDVTEPDPGPVDLRIRWGFETDDPFFLAQRGTAVPDSLYVEALDSTAGWVEGVTVHWRVTSGGGKVAPGMSVTRADGSARAAWTLGDQLGDQYVEATSPSSTDTVRFRAIANPPPPDDWADALALELTTDPAELNGSTSDALTATLTASNRWAGMVRVRTLDSCVAITGIYDASGAEVAVFPWGCHHAVSYHAIAPGETLEREWTLDEVMLDPGEYTVRADLHITGINGGDIELTPPETTLVVR